MLTPSVWFGNGCRMCGTIVTDGDCRLYECTITGHVWARFIVARDAEGSYTDYLIRSTINRETEERPFLLLGSAPMRIVFTRMLTVNGVVR
jgi:RNA polymerase subunit RPABC4/transcription elongation factor Spt4